MQTNALYYGDCLDWMKRWDDEIIDLVYADPPFNSNANYNILFSDRNNGSAQYRAFQDTWIWDEAAVERLTAYQNAPGRLAHDAIVGLHRILGACGMLAYLTYMAERLEHTYRLLKKTGSLYLHCDPTASHYLKILLDGIFGKKGGGRAFRNEIIWGYPASPSAARRDFPRKHDIILRYVKSSQWTFNADQVRIPYADSSLERVKYPANASKVMSGTDILLHKKGKIPPTPWLDIQQTYRYRNESLSYPTQKPLALMNRIIKASSNEEDVVLDPFCGCGTTVEAAKNLNRQFVGIDISSFAIDLIRNRRLKDKSIPVYGIPMDLPSAAKLAREDPFSFESWAVTRLPGFAPNTRQVADGGVDGRASIAHQPDDWDTRLALAQVKGGRFSLSGLRDFTGVINRDRAALGCFITLNPVQTPAAGAETANMGKISVEGYRFPRMQIWPISHYFDSRPPRLPIMNDPYTGKPLNQADLFA